MMLMALARTDIPSTDLIKTDLIVQAITSKVSMRMVLIKTATM